MQGTTPNPTEVPPRSPTGNHDLEFQAENPKILRNSSQRRVSVVRNQSYSISKYPKCPPPPPMDPALLSEIRQKKKPTIVPLLFSNARTFATLGEDQIPSKAMLTKISPRDPNKGRNDIQQYRSRTTTEIPKNHEVKQTSQQKHKRGETDAKRKSPSPTQETTPTSSITTKKKTKDKRKRILRRRTKSTKNVPSSLSVDSNLASLAGPSPPTKIEEVPATKKIILFRVRLQDDNYKTMTIEESTTASELCEKLSNKLRKERPEQIWDGCELFIETSSGEEYVRGSTILSQNIDAKYLFKRQGEKLANPEEELKKIIQKHAKRNAILCKLCFHCDIDDFSTEDHEYLNSLFDLLAIFIQEEGVQLDDSNLLPKRMLQQLETLEDQNNMAKKRYHNTKKKRPNRLFVDTTRITLLHKIAEPGGSYATIYQVMVDGMECAMKELILDGVTDTSAFLTEIAVLDALPPHDNLVQYVNFFLNVHFEVICAWKCW